jgi:hypothetical protein
MNNTHTVKPISTPILSRLDRCLSTLEVNSADIGAVLSKARFKRFKTYSKADMEALDKLLVPQGEMEEVL